ncbi:MAG: fibronectin type III domain-containing protein [Flavobacteriales bacterium]|nr:fibronectin type III domain-containing protein [Flavobacteriales bacterium]
MNRTKKFLALAGILLMGSWAHATTNKYRLTLRDDPSTTIVIGWNQVSGSGATVYYGPTDLGTNWSAYPNSKTPDRTVSDKGMTNTFARITGLQPNTNYYFVIKDSEGNSARYWFRTCPNTPSERLSFIAGGDSRNNATPRRNANKLVAKLKPHAVLFGGDMTDGGSNSEWGEWFDDWQLTIASDGRMFPIVATRGNHESSNSIIYNLFDVPSSEVYYALTFGGSLIRTYTLNTETSITGTQTNWLVNDLQASSGITWKTAQYHKPMRPHTSSKSEGNTQYSSWAQPFYDYGVRLVVECDAHTVKTTWPVMPSTGGGSDEGFIQENTNGTVYAGEGCWGAPLRTNNDDKTWTRNSGMFNQFKWVFVDQQKIEMRTINVDNADQVGSVSNNDPFTIPSNLNIWNPSNGSVITIMGGNTPPICNVTSPSTGTDYSSLQAITINVSASDADGSVTQVEFFVNGSSVGTDAPSPYSRSWTFPDWGSYALTAVATDDDGATTTSNTVYITATAPGSGECISIQADFNNFESGWGIWNDGGSDCARVSNSTYANSGSYSLQLRDNSSSSYSNTDVIDLSSFEEVTVSFSYMCNSMDNSNEDFWLQISTNGGSSYTTVEEWNLNDEFVNNQRYNDAVTIQGPFPSNVRFRFVCDASGNSDWVYIDDIDITGCSSGPVKHLVINDGSFGDTAADGIDEEDMEDIVVYPNPFSEKFTVDVSQVEGSGEISVYNIEGKLVYRKAVTGGQPVTDVHPGELPSGVYYLVVKFGNLTASHKLLKY